MNVPRTLSASTIDDCAAAVDASFAKLSAAASSAIELLASTGFAGTPGDTADDLRLAAAVHQHLLTEFIVKVRTIGATTAYLTKAPSSFHAYAAAASAQGETPCSIAVHPTEPNSGLLEAAHRALRIEQPFKDAMQHPALSIAISSYARKRPRRLIPRIDFKRIAANDRD
jgi:hypothetical protein